MMAKLVNQPVLSNEFFPGSLEFDTARFPWGEPFSARSYRLEAWEQAKGQSFPLKNEESWRRVDLSGLKSDVFKSESTVALQVSKRRPFDEKSSGKLAGMLEVHEGESYAWLSPELESAGVILMDLLSAEEKHSDLIGRMAGSVIPVSTGKFAAIAAALSNIGALLYIPRNLAVNAPFSISINAGSQNPAKFSHVLIWLEEGASCSVNLEYASVEGKSAGQTLHDGLLEISVGPNAQLKIAEMQNFHTDTWNITHEKAVLGQDSRLEWIVSSLGSRFTKSFITIDLNETGAEARVKGLYFSDSEQAFDLDTQQNHLAVSTKSDLLFKGAAKGHSKAIWQGMIYVAPGALLTDGYQSNKNLMLDDTADIQTIPGLEILADDVRCSHGATVGKLDEEELFYLQSRGIANAHAEELIVEGFFSEIIDEIPLEAIRMNLKEKISQKLAS